MVQVRFPSAIEPTDSELPVEVFVVPRRGTPTVWRRWLPIDRAGALQVPVSSQPLIVSGQVVRLPVDRSGDGWVPRALVPERALRAAERRLKELLQTDLPALAVQRHGVPLAAADRR